MLPQKGQTPLAQSQRRSDPFVNFALLFF